MDLDLVPDDRDAHGDLDSTFRREFSGITMHFLLLMILIEVLLIDLILFASSRKDVKFRSTVLVSSVLICFDFRSFRKISGQEFEKSAKQIKDNSDNLTTQQNSDSKN